MLVPESWYVTRDCKGDCALYLTVRSFVEQGKCEQIAGWIVQNSPFRLEIGLRGENGHWAISVPRVGVLAATRLQEGLRRHGRILLHVASMEDGMERCFVVAGDPSHALTATRG